ncbi:MAG TPA: WecB/TagA/CpsF family glycosyltransferase [Patescibacteria group bacterium]|nr:WecB/TagA/CpsF family glycosyltransferase [Patescibacteria group bacterium]
MKRGPKHGNIFGISLSSTTTKEVLVFVSSRLESREKFYIVTPNPEIMLTAKNDWLLKEALQKADFAVPDGIGLKFAYKFLHNERINIIKGRELFIDLIKLADEKALRVYFVGGENEEAQKSIDVLSKDFKNIVFKTHKTPQYGLNGQPFTEEGKKEHKELMASIKMFEPNLIFVGLGAPKQEKWILRYFFRLNAVIGAMTVGGVFNYISGNSKFPPEWMARLGLEWFWRVVNEPKRIKRIIKATIVFPWTIILVKLLKQRFKS